MTKENKNIAIGCGVIITIALICMGAGSAITYILMR